jgi:hypothetical protein
MEQGKSEEESRLPGTVGTYQRDGFPLVYGEMIDTEYFFGGVYPSEISGNEQWFQTIISAFPGRTLEPCPLFWERRVPIANSYPYARIFGINRTSCKIQENVTTGGSRGPQVIKDTGFPPSRE